MNTQPEALRLAEQLDGAPYSSFCTNEAAAELRRLYKENIALRQAIEQAQKNEVRSQEPVARKKHEPTIDLDKYAGTYGGYTSPPQRQPLTDGEIRKVKHHMVDGAYHYSFMQGVRYAEAAHGIKE